MVKSKNNKFIAVRGGPYHVTVFTQLSQIELVVKQKYIKC